MPDGTARGDFAPMGARSIGILLIRAVSLAALAAHSWSTLLDHVVGYQQHYAKLFEHLQLQYGDLDGNTIMAIIGFAAGGPVNMCAKKSERLFVTCALSIYEEQMKSTEGLKFEFFCKDDFDEVQARAIFTALGRLSMDARLGDNHTVDLANARTTIVQLRLFSETLMEGAPFGLYRVRPAS